MRVWLSLLGLGILLLLGLATVAPVSFLPAAYLGSFILYATAVHLAEHDTGSFKLIIAFSIVFRGFLLLLPPFLSDDIFRYHWDGILQTHGINPYEYAPDSPVLSEFRDEYWSKINNQNIPTIYPPLTQVVFLGASLASPHPIALKTAMAAFDLLCLLMLTRLLELRGESRSHAIVYAWHPLVLFEISSSGHCDPIAMFFLLLGTVSIIRGEIRLSNRGADEPGHLRLDARQPLLWLSASFMSKLFPVLFLPMFLRRIRIRRWWWFLVLPIALSAVYIRPESGLFASLREYSRIWRFNDSVFWVIEGFVGDLHTSKMICAGVVGVATMCAAFRRCRIEDQIFWSLGFFLLFSPQLDPWRLIWVVPFLAVRMRLSWLLLTGTIALSYHPFIIQGPAEGWVELPLFKLLEFAPFFVVGAVELMRAVARRPHRRL